MSALIYSPVVSLHKKQSGNFSAFIAREQDFNGLMSPVLGFDHFRLTGDVFGPHRHAGISALSYIFEDSTPFHNQDSMGTDLTISPGSLLWTWAGNGVIHHEYPVKNDGKIHGLQLFLDIPEANKPLPPKSLYIPVTDMPVLSAAGISVKVVSGISGQAINVAETPDPLTLLDVSMEPSRDFEHRLPAGWNGTVYILSGKIIFGGTAFFELKDNEAISFGAATSEQIVSFTAITGSRFLLISGPVRK